MNKLFGGLSDKIERMGLQNEIVRNNLQNFSKAHKMKENRNDVSDRLLLINQSL